MVSCKFYMVLAIVGVFIIPSISAREIVVGDDAGWTIDFDYQKWVEGKDFYIGDTLVFKYPAGQHNVLRVNGTGFQQCEAPNNVVAVETGNDVITLSSPGRKWYICGIPNHCDPGNMRLAITVFPQLGSPVAASSPTEIPLSSATSSIVSLNHWWMLCIAIFIGVVMV